MSRNLSRTSCKFCDQKVVLEEEPRPIRASDYRRFADYDNLFAHAKCEACEAQYIAWVTFPSGFGSLANYDLDEGQTHRDLSFRSTFNDEPGPTDMPRYKVSVGWTREPITEVDHLHARVAELEAGQGLGSYARERRRAMMIEALGYELSDKDVVSGLDPDEALFHSLCTQAKMWRIHDRLAPLWMVRLDHATKAMRESDVDHEGALTQVAETLVAIAADLELSLVDLVLAVEAKLVLSLGGSEIARSLKQFIKHEHGLKSGLDISRYGLGIDGRLTDHQDPLVARATTSPKPPSKPTTE